MVGGLFATFFSLCGAFFYHVGAFLPIFIPWWGSFLGFPLPLPGASPGFGRGGAKKIFSDLGICMSRSDMLRMAKPCALLGGSGACPPREFFFETVQLVRFRVYFDQILSLFFSKNAIFYIKKKYFRYTFVMGYFS